MVTMEQVAERANVSQATVSHVLAGKADQNRISQQTRDRVLEAAHKLGYHRNLIARAMVTGKSRMIGIVTDAWAVTNTVQIMAGAMEAANDHDYLLKMLYLSQKMTVEDIVTRCLEWRIAGVVTMGLPDDRQYRLQDEFQRINLSLVLVDNAVQTERAMRFVSDDALGIQMVVSHLVELGHDRIAFLGGKPSELSNWRERSFRSAIARAGLDLPSHWVRNTSWGVYSVIEEGVWALLREDRPTAIVCSSDSIAMVVINVARSIGLQLPAELSITGYSNVDMSRFTNPHLTTVDQPFQAIGHSAVMHLIHLADNETLASSQEVLLPTRLVVRDSTAPPNMEKG